MNSADDGLSLPKGEGMPRILIIRPSAIGDLVMASPILRVLKEGYPGAHLSWLVEPQIKEVLANNPYVDQLIEWPKSDWSSLWRERRYLDLWHKVRDFRTRLRQEQFDLVLDAQGLLRSRLLARLSSGTIRIGFDSKEPGRFLMTRIISRGENSDRMSSEYRHMMVELGLDAGAFHPCLAVSPAVEQIAADVLVAQGVTGNYVVIAPFTTRPQKHWFAERWAELAKRIVQTFRLPVVVLGGPADQPAAEEIVGLSAGQVISLVGHTRLAASMAVIKHSQLLVGVDTGLTHMGPAFDRPTVALFGATCPYLKTSRDNSKVLYRKRDCSPCKRSPSCDGRFDCMADITVDEVLETVRPFLKTAG